MSPFIDSSLENIQRSTNELEKIMRTGFLNVGENKNYLQIQRLHDITRLLKAQIHDIMCVKGLSTSDNFKVQTVIETSQLYLGKVDALLSHDIHLEGDLLRLDVRQKIKEKNQTL